MFFNNTKIIPRSSWFPGNLSKTKTIWRLYFAKRYDTNTLSSI